MKQIKQIQKYHLDVNRNKHPIGRIEYIYDEWQQLSQKKIYDHSDTEHLRITTIIFDSNGNEIVRKTDTQDVRFSLKWEISTYNQNGKLTKVEGGFDNDDEKYEALYHYDEDGELTEEIWSKGNNVVCTKFERKGEFYEGISDHNHKVVLNKKMKTVLTEYQDEKGDLLYRRLCEDFDKYGNPYKGTIFCADKGTTTTEKYKRDEDGNLLEKNVYISVGDLHEVLLATEIREIEYCE